MEPFTTDDVHNSLFPERIKQSTCTNHPFSLETFDLKKTKKLKVDDTV